MWKFGQPQDSLLCRFRSRRFEVSDLFPAQWDGSSPDCPSKKRNKDWMHSLGNYARAIQPTIQSLLRFFDGQSGLEPSHCAGNKSETSNRRDRKRQSNESCGCPNFHITAKTFTGMTKIRRHHPDDGVAILVQANSFADYVRIAAELSLPQCVTDHHGIQKTWDPICWGVCTPQCRFRPQHVKITRTRAEHLDALHPFATG